MQTRKGYDRTSVSRGGASETARRYIAAAIGVLAAVYAVTFLVGALLHLGVRIPAGAEVLAESRIFPASVVEGLCGFFLAAGAYAALTGRTWAWPALIVAHGFALGGVLLGVAALAVGAGPSTELNEVYHRVMLVALAAGLVLLLAPVGRTAFGRGGRVGGGPDGGDAS